jgi:cytochrome c553
MRIGLSLSAAGAVLLTVSGLVGAEGDFRSGRSKSVACQACHGKRGISVAPQYPNLACQKRQYLEKALRSYKFGGRNDPMMSAAVASLSELDIDDLAAYFSRIGCKNRNRGGRKQNSQFQ